MTANVPAQWVTPTGQLSVAPSGAVTALLRTSLRNDEAIGGAVNAITKLARPPVFGPATVERSELGYTLNWPAAEGVRTALSLLAPEWRREPALHLSQAIKAALGLFRAASELQQLAPHAYLLSPPQCFLETDNSGRESWVFLPLPFEAVQFKDLATGSPEAIAWLGGEQLARRSGTDIVYMAGALLHHALVADDSTAGLAPMKLLLRQLSYRSVRTGAVRSMTAAAVPRSLSAAAQRLGDFVLSCVSPPYGRSWTTNQALAALQRLEAELSPPLLAGGWEMEGCPDRALAILESMAKSAPPEEVPWRTIERLRGGRQPEQDLTEPLPKPTAGTPRPPETLAGRVHALLAQGPEGLEALATMIEELVHRGAHALPENERLFVAYAMGRWLNAPAAARQFLAAPCAVTWNSAVRALLLARLHLERGEWTLTAKDCRECMRAIQSLPGDRGGDRGSYAQCFALMLDVAAHVGIVRAGHSIDYVADGWTRLKQAMDLWPRTRSLALAEAMAAQVGGLRGLAESAGLDSIVVEMGAARSRLAVPDNDEIDRPVPWPDDAWLFA